MTGKDSEAPVSRIDDLKPGMEVTGKVSRTNLHGAFIDIGMDVEGFMHISMLKRSPIDRVEDVLKVGQEIKAWVQTVDKKQKRLELSMVRPVTVKWSDLAPGMLLKGKVVRLESFGAFVDVGTVRPGLVHVSEMSDEYVANPSQLVTVGDEVQVTVIAVDSNKRQIRLSMKVEEAEVIDEETPQETIPTAMEVALRQALEDASAHETGETPKPKRSPSGRKLQEDLLQRTLEQRVRTSSSTEPS